jgi:transcriptional regulator with XRE-family HTH domain
MDTREAIHEIKKTSGLTWEQLAELFNILPRTLYFWASGKQLSSFHRETLYRLVDVFRYINRGNADINRQALISAQENGQTPFALLKEKRYEDVKKLLGEGKAKIKHQLKPLDEAFMFDYLASNKDLLATTLELSVPLAVQEFKKYPERLDEFRESLSEQASYLGSHGDSIMFRDRQETQQAFVVLSRVIAFLAITVPEGVTVFGVHFIDNPS